MNGTECERSIEDDIINDDDDAAAASRVFCFILTPGAPEGSSFNTRARQPELRASERERKYERQRETTRFYLTRIGQSDDEPG